MKTSILALALLFLSACSSGDSDETVADSTETAAPPAGPEVRRAAEALPGLYAWMSRQDSAFRPEGFAEFSPLVEDTVPAQPMPEAERARWAPYLLYNSDSSLALDLYSYNYVLRQRNGKTSFEEGGPDFEVGVIDLKAGTRRRLFFTGPGGGYVLDAAWADSRNVLLGVAEVSGPDRFRPTLHRIDARSGTHLLSTYPTPLSGNASAYPRPFPDPAPRPF